MIYTSGNPSPWKISHRKFKKRSREELQLRKWKTLVIIALVINIPLGIATVVLSPNEFGKYLWTTW